MGIPTRRRSDIPRKKWKSNTRSGKFGSVYRVRYPGTGNYCAVKVIDVKDLKEKGWWKTGLRGSDDSHTFNHDNIVKYYHPLFYPDRG